VYKLGLAELTEVARFNSARLRHEVKCLCDAWLWGQSRCHIMIEPWSETSQSAHDMHDKSLSGCIRSRGPTAA
jgi:hypothetical protein